MIVRMSRSLTRTMRSAPSDAEAEGHRLLVRAGYVRRVASGVYSFLPLGLRVLHRVEQVVREELDQAGCEELLLPALHPMELWERSGRARLIGGEALPAFVVEGRGGRFVLGPTHEEVVTATVAAEVDSHRQLPVVVYQVQTKFRDEPRPRFGLVRTREFVMADAYSFDADAAGMCRSYEVVFSAFERIFDRLGLDVVAVAAKAGAIGGEVNHEFMVPSPVGEDAFVRCGACGYAANTEAARTGRPARRADEEGWPEQPVEVPTPNASAIAEVVAVLAEAGWPVETGALLKAVALVAPDGAPTVALVPGDREVRVPEGYRLFDDADFARHPELEQGFIGPQGLAGRGVRVVADPLVAGRTWWAAGANRHDRHVVGLRLGRDFDVDEWVSIATVAGGDPCPECGAGLEVVRSVEVGHTFQLGLAYSSKIPGATFVDEAGAERPFWMGCYGIGVSRLPAVLAEACRDDRGLAWPEAVAPFDVHVVALGGATPTPVVEAAERIVAGLEAAGRSVLFDDRDASPGVKLHDADLIGMPWQVVVGHRGLERGVVEWRARSRDRGGEVALDQAPATLPGLLRR
jgi:prolyl-tRNA synthetase